MISNKYLGNRYEKLIGQILADNGFWVHNFQQNAAGQPADLIAINYHSSHLIDCKFCSNHRFSLDRVEENQVLAMDHWCEKGMKQTAWFCVGFGDDTYMIPWKTIKSKLAEGASSLGETWIAGHCKTLYWWMDNWK